MNRIFNSILFFSSRFKTPPLLLPLKLLATRGWIGVLLLTSCSNDLAILDDWKETTVVYGLLNQDDTVGGKPQYIKIYKAYLGEGNALQMAQNYDSVNYANQLNVQLERWLAGSKIETYTLQKDFSIPKDSGVFSAPDQVLYTTNEPLYENSDYQLVITNSSSGNVVKAKTGLIKKFIVSSPSAGGALSLSNPLAKQIVKWTSSKNGKLYQLVIRFHYDEVEIPFGAIVHKYVDWVFPSQKSAFTAGGELMTTAFLNADFYRFLGAVIPKNNNVARFARNRKIEYIFSVAAEDFDTYMDVYKPSNGIVQDKPEFTNVENGLGLFSSRLNIIVSKDSLTKQSVDSLISGQYTSDLGFQ